jgi:hypothetical protein
LGRARVSSSAFSIITTIQKPTKAVIGLLSVLKIAGTPLLVVGDRKGPSSFDIEGALFLSLQDQIKSDFALAQLLPENHYARKNIGYLYAMSQGASCIYETDDDNAPLDNWDIRTKTVSASKIEMKGWVNAYRFFTSENIWPRGFPLDEIAAREKLSSRGETCEVEAPIQQGLADNSPDVDAIWRLVLDTPFQFEKAESAYLQPGAWCPFNSQSTWWWPEAYFLMYLPSYCSFRMTDIWRSFIAQRCLWEMGCGVVFHGAEVVQERNPHNLMRDFVDEIPGFTRNKEFVSALERLYLRSGSGHSGHNLLCCYETLVKASFFEERELSLIEAWIADVQKILGAREGADKS